MAVSSYTTPDSWVRCPFRVLNYTLYYVVVAVAVVNVSVRSVT